MMGNQGGACCIELLYTHGSDSGRISVENDVVRYGPCFIAFERGVFKGKRIVVADNGCLGILCVHAAVCQCDVAIDVCAVGVLASRGEMAAFSKNHAAVLGYLHSRGCIAGCGNGRVNDFHHGSFCCFKGRRIVSCRCNGGIGQVEVGSLAVSECARCAESRGCDGCLGECAVAAMGDKECCVHAVLIGAFCIRSIAGLCECVACCAHVSVGNAKCILVSGCRRISLSIISAVCFNRCCACSLISRVLGSLRRCRCGLGFRLRFRSWCGLRFRNGFRGRSRFWFSRFRSFRRKVLECAGFYGFFNIRQCQGHAFQKCFSVVDFRLSSLSRSACGSCRFLCLGRLCSCSCSRCRCCIRCKSGHRAGACHDQGAE